MGLALLCPLLAGIHDVPEPDVVVSSGTIGNDEFRDYFGTPQDGIGSNARFRYSSASITTDDAGNVYVPDGQSIRQVRAVLARRFSSHAAPHQIRMRFAGVR